METSGLRSAAYWESDAVGVRLNPKRDLDAMGLIPFLCDQCGIRHSIVMATSGSSGEPKFAVLSKGAILASAAAVNEHCGITSEDVWLAGLSDFHVGGLGIHARAFLSGSEVVRMSGSRWDRTGETLVNDILEAKATLTSLTPTHLFDLVRHDVKAPDSLRGVLLGGGRMYPEIISRAKDLGWPVWPSYGMTEACSQIATSLDGECEWLSILSHWETRVTENERLAIRGAALFSGYAQRSKGKWMYHEATGSDGWYETGDLCEVKEGKLRFRSRADDLIKISGELISLSSLDATAMEIARSLGVEAAMVSRPDPRRENELVLIVEGVEELAESVRTKFNERVGGLESVKRAIAVQSLPRTEIGKVNRAELNAIVS